MYNDGSPEVILDATLGKAYKYGFSRTNRGVSYARNRCVEMVDTPLIYPMDCDDVLVPGAISKLLTYWDGNTPVYSDLLMFGDGGTQFRQLPQFTCENVKAKLGIASVNVLHTVEQWKSIGGWDESLTLYEDAEYNARLMLTHCGVKYPAPLVQYRQHSNQRTQVHKNKAKQLADDILAKMRGYEMACVTCGSGSRRSKVGVAPKTPAKMVTSSVGHGSSMAPSIPGKSTQMVKAHYMGGKGKGPHYQRGLSTGYAYKVVYDMELMVDYKDTRHKDDTRNNSPFIRLEELPGQQDATFQPEEPVEVINRQPMTSMEKTPVIDDDTKDSIDLHNLSFRRLQTLDMTAELAKNLLTMEKNGRNRKKHVEYLEGYVNA